ncbi:MAG: hypothetical protein M3527_04675 [Actinomycetota bacterium]|nr:hypothetical protein [Acidimicrobiia bacterium]MDQ3293729.1 hypothetical protein [Actinomycetota bacterium]
MEAFQQLHAHMEAAADRVEDPKERLLEVGVAYVVTGRDFPAHCSIVFRADLVDTTDPDYQEWGEQAYSFLEATIRAVAERYNPSLDIDDASRLCWAAMQGLLVLHTPMDAIARQRGEAPVDPVEQARASTRLILMGLVPGRQG